MTLARFLPVLAFLPFGVAAQTAPAPSPVPAPPATSQPAPQPGQSMPLPPRQGCERTPPSPTS